MFICRTILNIQFFKQRNPAKRGLTFYLKSTTHDDIYYQPIISIYASGTIAAISRQEVVIYLCNLCSDARNKKFINFHNSRAIVPLFLQASTPILNHHRNSITKSQNTRDCRNIHNQYDVGFAIMLITYSSGPLVTVDRKESLIESKGKQEARL